MRPTYQAIMEIEQAAGVGVVPIARRVLANEHGLTEAVAIITAGLRASGEPATPDKVGQMVLDDGLLNLTAPLVEFLTNALSGGEEAEPGEAEAEEATASHTETSPPSPTPS